MFTSQETKWLVNNFDKFDDNIQLHKAFVSKFNTQIKYDNFRHRLFEDLNLRRHARAHSWSDEELDWLRDRTGSVSREQLCKDFNQRFNLSISLPAFVGTCIRYGILSGRERRHKGLKNRVDHPIGTKYTDKDGYVWVKVRSDGKGQHENWMPEQRYVWEQVYGKIPKGYVVINLDRDRSNVSLSNLACISRAQSALLNVNNWFSDNADITRSAVRWTELKLLLPKE